jgi:hypothetical protein
MRLRSFLCIAVFSVGCGEGSPFSRDPVAREFGSLEFDSSRWKSGDRQLRGKMVASLMRSRIGRTTTNAQIIALLGPSECYVNYDDEPCYVLTSNQKAYRLEFSVNHSTHPGRIVGVGINEPVRSVNSVQVDAVKAPDSTR